MARHFVSKKEVKSLQESLNELGLELGNRSVEIDERKGEKCYFINGKPCVYISDRVIPTLFLLNDIKPARRYVTVDDGAVPHVINGANVFAQGITDIDPEIQEGVMVFIRNTGLQYIAVGISSRSAADIMKDQKGEAIILLHFPGDKIMKTFYS